MGCRARGCMVTETHCRVQPLHLLASGTRCLLLPVAPSSLSCPRPGLLGGWRHPLTPFGLPPWAQLLGEPPTQGRTPLLRSIST